MNVREWLRKADWKAGCTPQYEKFAIGALVVGALFWACTWGCSWWLVPWHYGSFLVMGTGATWWAACRLPKLHFFLGIVGGGLTIISLFLWASHDTYSHHYSLDGAHYHDTKTRWGGTVIYRRILSTQPPLLYTEGPASEGGSQHGRWIVEVDNDGDERMETRRYFWYWYGEDVTEAEFRRRQRAE